MGEGFDPFQNKQNLSELPKHSPPGLALRYLPKFRDSSHEKVGQVLRCLRHSETSFPVVESLPHGIPQVSRHKSQSFVRRVNLVLNVRSIRHEGNLRCQERAASASFVTRCSVPAYCVSSVGLAPRVCLVFKVVVEISWDTIR